MSFRYSNAETLENYLPPSNKSPNFRVNIVFLSFFLCHSINDFLSLLIWSQLSIAIASLKVIEDIIKK